MKNLCRYGVAVRNYFSPSGYTEVIAAFVYRKDAQLYLKQIATNRNQRLQYEIVRLPDD